MTVSASTGITTSEGDGLTVSFPFAFEIPDAAALVVKLYDTGEDPATLETITPSLYSASGFGDPDGGAVVFPLSGDAVTSGQFIAIYREQPAVQETSLQSIRFFSHSIEDALDYQTRTFQDLATRIEQLQPLIGGIPVPVMPAADPDPGTFDTVTATTGSFTQSAATTGTVSTGILSGLGVATSTTVTAVVSGQTVTLSGTLSFTPLSLTQSSAALTVHLPPSPVHGQSAGFSIDQNVTVLTVSGNGHTLKNAPLTTSTQSGGWTFVWAYDAGSATWWRRSGIAPIPPVQLLYYTASVAQNFASTTTGFFASVGPTTVTGSDRGDVFMASMIGVSAADEVYQGFLSVCTGATGAARVSWYNLSGGTLNPGNGTLQIVVLPKSQFP